MIHIGDKFKVHWVGHESSYVDKVYQVTSFIADCTCGKPFYYTGGPGVPRRMHIHIKATLIEAPRPEMIGEKNFWFGPLDEDTLRYIDDPNEWLELVRRRGDQLSLFKKI